MKRLILSAAVAATVLLAACAEESSRPNPSGKGTVRAINAVPASPEIVFLIEEVSNGSAEYKDATTTAEWDALSYTFNFEVFLAGASTRTRVASTPLDVKRDTDYTFLITGTLNAPNITLYEAPQREWATADTVFEVRFGHLGATLGDIDVYFDDAAVPPTLGAQRATLSATSVSEPIELPAGDYALTITPAGDDTTILFVTDGLTFASQSSFLINVFDGDEDDLSPLAVRTLNTTAGGGAAALLDTRFLPTLRFIQASRNLVTSDIYVDDPLTVPVVSDHDYRDIDGPVEVMAGTVPITYVDSTNMGSMLIDADLTVFGGARLDLYVVNDSDGNDQLISATVDRRSISTFARFGLINAAAGRDAIDMYLVPRGEPIDDVNAFFSDIPLASIPLRFPLDPDAYDLYVTDVDVKTPLAGPVALDLAAGDVVEILLLDNLDPTVVDVMFIP